MMEYMKEYRQRKQCYRSLRLGKCRSFVSEEQVFPFAFFGGGGVCGCENEKEAVLLHQRVLYEPSCYSVLSWEHRRQLPAEIHLCQAYGMLTLMFLYPNTLPWSETGRLPKRYLLRSRKSLEKLHGNER